jgi:hypothetical protein
MSVKIFTDFRKSDIDKNQYIFCENIEECDFVFLDFRIRTKQTKIYLVTENNIPEVKKMRDLAIKHNKKFVYLCGGDRPPKILPNDLNSIIFKTSIDKKNKPNNEYAFGVCVNDKFLNEYLINPNLSIGFIGHTGHGRQKYIDYLTKSNIKTDFIIRDQYFGTIKCTPLKTMENEFFQNISNNLFTFCYRGGGNFSVRFYEVIMMGRIPLVIDTDCMFPYEDEIDYSKVGLFIKESELNENFNLEERMNNWYETNKDNLLDIQKNNRMIYEKYFYKQYWSMFFKYCKKIIE